MKPYFDSLCGPFEVDWEGHKRLNHWQEDEFELGARVATALMGGYMMVFDTDKFRGLEGDV